MLFFKKIFSLVWDGFLRYNSSRVLLVKYCSLFCLNFVMVDLRYGWFFMFVYLSLLSITYVLFSFPFANDLLVPSFCLYSVPVLRKIFNFRRIGSHFMFIFSRCMMLTFSKSIQLVSLLFAKLNAPWEMVLFLSSHISKYDLYLAASPLRCLGVSLLQSSVEF